MTLEPCGTRAAYARHLRAGHRPCDECVAANANFKRELKKAGERNRADRKRRGSAPPTPTAPPAPPPLPPIPARGESMTLVEFVYLVNRERFRERASAQHANDRLAQDDHRITRCRGCGAWKSTTGARCRPCVTRARRTAA